MDENSEGLETFLDEMGMNYDRTYSDEDENYNYTYDAYYDEMDMDYMKSLEKAVCDFFHYKHNCSVTLEAASKPDSSVYCRGEYDLLCWPDALPESVVKVPCFPKYPGTLDVLYGHRYCLKDGSWLSDYNSTTGQYLPRSYVDSCGINPMAFQGMAEDPHEVDDVVDTEEMVFTTFRIIYTCGYALSLVCLILALLILSLFKRLHCTRNYIHMNLMISFILRYSIAIIKDVVIDIKAAKPAIIDNMPNFCVTTPDDSRAMLLHCRSSAAMMYYALIANYFWLLVEGVYLQMLLIYGQIQDKMFVVFMLFAWGAPWAFVILWTSLNIIHGGDDCWYSNDGSNAMWAIQAPLIVSILINVAIFISIIRTIVQKLRAKHMTKKDYKFRLAKSTLALIPLLAIHYVITLIISETVDNRNEAIRFTKLGMELFLTSIQGILIALFYCFLNGEVKCEMKRWWRERKWKAGIPRSTSSKCFRTNTKTKQSSLTEDAQKTPNLKWEKEKLIIWNETGQTDTIGAMGCKYSTTNDNNSTLC